MKRFFTIAVAAALAAGLSHSAWSQSGQSGGTGASGGASASGTPSTSGATGAAGTAGTAAGTSGITSGAAGTAGVTGQAQAGVNQNRAGANARAQGMSRNPWFSDPGVRQQLNMSESQYNQLNRAYQNAYARQNLNANTQGRAGAAAPGRQQLNDLRRRTGTDPNNLNNNNAATQRQLQQQQQSRYGYGNEFNTALDQVLTDRQMRQRFDQLERQYQGPSAFNDPRVQQQLNLSNDQQRQVRRLASQWRDQMDQLRRAGRDDPGATQQQFAAMRQQYQSQLSSFLTPTQQQAWNEMTGEPYDFPAEAYQTGEGANIDPPEADQDPGLQERNVVPYGGARSNTSGGSVR